MAADDSLPYNVLDEVRALLGCAPDEEGEPRQGPLCFVCLRPVVEPQLYCRVAGLLDPDILLHIKCARHLSGMLHHLAEITQEMEE